MPRVLPHTGTVLSNLQLVTLTFDDYADRAQVETFGDMLVRSSWYGTVGSKYGLQPGNHVQKASLGQAPAPDSRPLSRVDIAGLIKQAITNPNVPQPSAANGQLLYLAYIPPGVPRDAGLAGVRGYHDVLTLDSLPVADRVPFPIAVVLDDGTGLPATTSTAAHQLINAATNPFPPPMDGYYADPPMTDPWSLILREVADLCYGEDPIVESGFTLPRVYSNEAAETGMPPCMPLNPGDAWSDVSAVPSKMQIIPRGGSVTFKLTGWSTQEVPDWKLTTQAADFSDLTRSEMRPELSSDTINNGISVMLTLHAPVSATSGAAGGVYVLSGDKIHPWAVGFRVE